MSTGYIQVLRTSRKCRVKVVGKGEGEKTTVNKDEGV